MVLDFDFDFVLGLTDTIAGYPFNTVQDYFIKIAEQESILGFFKGMSSPMFGVAIINGIVLFFYSKSFKKFI
ncbi:unnamed protein product [Rotaria sordida]|uniref:Uncharacterized protein n=1 Tax=Rotaria sordida TaxID=392033 RepID=A0A816C3Y8_9BILA|nr:unnamed protein product [Rotaria sordida]CAF1617041.1 unnamed protein product [Rotaria sordida]